MNPKPTRQDKKSRLRDAKRRITIVQEILLRRWDPTWVCDEPEAFDEYDRYALHMVSMVMRGCTLEELAAYLSSVCVEEIGLAADSARERDIAAEILQALHDFEKGQSPTV